ncbi:MAG: sulfate adenylyltransferase subunit CysN [Deltaproteobacteria bacterium]|nr:sulfate adenylyltransferase subunit CysN [Deltaproteobacteria bacterium]
MRELEDAELARTDIEGYLRRHEHKELLRLVVIGSVDDGKSTLIGRLLHDAHGIYEDQLSAVQRASSKGATRGEGSEAAIDFSLLTDGLRAEREQGITIDVAYRYFSTARRKFIIADTPGHLQYTRNMATGASTANVAIILIDARLGVLAQTRRHAYIASLLGIPHLCACVNKMDLVGWDQAVFQRIADELGAFAGKLGIPDVRCLPISALRGDHVVDRGDVAPWYTGPTLLEYIEEVPLTGDLNLTDLRFPVQYVIRPSLDYRGFAGQIASGVVRRGDELVALPSGRRSTVTSIDTHDGPLEEAFAPMSVTLRLADAMDISRGDMLVREGARPESSQRLDAMLVWMAERPMDPDKSYLIKHTTRMVRASIERVVGIVDPDTLQPVPAPRLGLNDIGRVELRCHQPLFFDAYRRNRGTGAFILIDSLSNDTVAAGMIQAGTSAATGADAGPARENAPQVSAAERRARLGQSGAVVTIGGSDGASARERAFLIERVLFDAGLVAAVVPEVGAAAVAAAGVIALVVVPRPALALDGAAVTSASDDHEAAARAVLAALGAAGRTS